MRIALALSAVAVMLTAVWAIYEIGFAKGYRRGCTDGGREVRERILRMLYGSN